MNVSTLLSNARDQVRDPNGVDLTDNFGMTLINDALEYIHKTLQDVLSRLVINEDELTTTDGTQEYTLKTGGGSIILANGLLHQGLWKKDNQHVLDRIVGEDLVPVYRRDPTSTGEPAIWWPTSLNSLKFHPIPDGAYTYKVQYFIATKSISATGDTIPFEGIFDRVIQFWVIANYLQTINADASYYLVQLQQMWNQAMNYTYDHGVQHFRVKSDFFTASGV